MSYFILHHVFRQVGYYFLSNTSTTVAMSLEAYQFTQLMNAITATKEGIEANILSRLDKFQKRAWPAACWQSKTNKAQFTFNRSIEDHIDATKKNLAKTSSTSDVDKATNCQTWTRVRKLSISGRSISILQTAQTGGWWWSMKPMNWQMTQTMKKGCTIKARKEQYQTVW